MTGNSIGDLRMRCKRRDGYVYSKYARPMARRSTFRTAHPITLDVARKPVTAGEAETAKHRYNAYETGYPYVATLDPRSSHRHAADRKRQVVGRAAATVARAIRPPRLARRVS